MDTNLEYFTYSLNHKESLLDKNYFFLDESIIDKEKNPLVLSEKKLNDTIIEYSEKKEEYNLKHEDMPEDERDEYIKKIASLLELESMNLTSFAQSFAIFDASFSLYDGLSKKEKIYFLSEILDSFVSSRLSLYKEIGSGYLQILYDSHSHKRMGSLGAKKILKDLKK